VVIDYFVTVVEMAMQAYLPALYESHGTLLFRLFVVNCLMLGRAEAYHATKNTVFSYNVRMVMGMGLGFSVWRLTLLGATARTTGDGQSL
jgi:electron transport complex protein RnfE